MGEGERELVTDNEGLGGATKPERGICTTANGLLVLVVVAVVVVGDTAVLTTCLEVTGDGAGGGGVESEGEGGEDTGQEGEDASESSGETLGE